MKKSLLRVTAAVMALAISLGMLVALPFSASAESAGTGLIGTIAENSLVIPEADATIPTVSTPETDTVLSVYEGVDSAVAPTTVDDEGYTLITSAAEFAYVVITPGCGDTAGNKYRLTTGIDLNKTFPFFQYPFNAELDGAGHTLHNLYSRFGGAAVEKKAVGLFTTVGGTIKNLVLTDVDVRCTTNYLRSIAGALVGTLENGGVLDGIVMRTGLVSGFAAGNIVAHIAAGEGGTAIIRNCVVEETFSTTMGRQGDGNQYLGGIACYAISGNITIENCYNFATPVNTQDENVTVNRYGGILAYVEQADTCRTTIKNCVNTGDYIAPTTYNQYTRQLIVGGIVATSGYSTIIGCRNYGNLTATGGSLVQIGGIAGSFVASNDYNETIGYAYTEVSDCINYGAIYGAGDEKLHVGGIAGSVGSKTAEATVSDCFNYGAVTAVPSACRYNSGFGTSYTRTLNCMAGGIIGHTDTEKRSFDFYMDGCGNAGEINIEIRTSQTFNIAMPKDGVAPVEYDVNLSLHLNALYAGGLIGRTGRTAVITNSTNLSDVAPVVISEPSAITTDEGVVVKSLTETLTINKISIGGAVGRAESGTLVPITFENLKNEGNVAAPENAAEAYVGGITGCVLGQRNAFLSLTVNGCINNGNVSAVNSTAACAAGMIGYTSYSELAAVTGCINRGNITVTGGTGTTKVGGLFSVAKTASDFTDCANFGDITATGEVTKLGGIISEITDSGTGNFTNCSNYGDLTVNYTPKTSTVTATTTVERNLYFDIGGLAGRIVKEMSAVNSVNAGEITLNVHPDYNIVTAVPEGSETAAITVNTKTTINAYVGGVIGRAMHAATIKNFTNQKSFTIDITAPTLNIIQGEGVTATAGTAEYSRTSYVGGIAAMIGHKDPENPNNFDKDAASVIENCVNHGDMVSTGLTTSYAGGLAAYIGGAMTMSNCVNYGDVASYGKNAASAGGFFGECPATHTSVIGMTSCANFGDVSLTNYVATSGKHPAGRAGGFVGSMGAGGSGGYVDLIAKNCAQYGNINAAVGDAGAGAVIGYTNIGHITAKTGMKISLSGCYIAGTVAGGSASGGLLGYFDPSDWPNNTSRFIIATLTDTVLAPTLMPHIANAKGGTGGEGVLYGLVYKNSAAANAADTFTITNSYLRVTDTQPLMYTASTYCTNLVKDLAYDVYDDSMMSNGTVQSLLNTYATANTFAPWAQNGDMPLLVTTLGFTGASMSLGSTMSLNMLLDASALERIGNLTSVQFATADGTAETKTMTAPSGEYYSAAYVTRAADMAKEMQLYIIVNVGGVEYKSSNMLTYSPITYINHLYGKTDHKEYDSYLPVLGAMVGYGMEAEKNAYGTSEIASAAAAGITSPTWSEGYNGHIAADAYDKTALQNYVDAIGVRLTGGIELEFHLKSGVTSMTVAGGGEAVNQTYTADENGVVTISGMHAGMIRTRLALTFADGAAAVPFTVGNYLNDRMTGDPAEAALIQATILYMMAVRTYALNQYQY